MENMTNAAGFPLFASKPHFLDGDLQLQQSVEGLSPSTENHNTYVDFEPLTGVSMRVAKRLQLNTFVSNWGLPVFKDTALKDEIKLAGGMDDLVALFDCLEIESNWSGVEDAYVPYAWVDENYAYSDDDAEDIYSSVYGTKDFAKSAAIYGGAAAGTLLMCAAWSFFYRNKVRREYSDGFRPLTGD